MEIVIVPATLLALTFGVLWAGRLFDPGKFQEVLEQAKRNVWSIAAAAVLLFVLAVSPPFFVALAGLLVLVLFARSWMHEFVFLMNLKDADFPGRFDKLVWALLMIGMPPVGLWLFRGYHIAHWPETKSATAKKADFLSDFV